jgi:hypothetical protein
MYDTGRTTLVEFLLNNYDCTEHDVLAYLFDDGRIQALLGRYVELLTSIAERTQRDNESHLNQIPHQRIGMLLSQLKASFHPETRTKPREEPISSYPPFNKTAESKMQEAGSTRRICVS